MLHPAELKSDQKLLWSQGRGTDVWALMQACESGDLKAVRALIAKDPSLARSHYDYRKPLYFAARDRVRRMRNTAADWHPFLTVVTGDRRQFAF